MKKSLLFILLVFGSPSILFAVVYETCNTGTWGNNAGSTTIRFSTDGGATCTINPYSITWAANDQLVVKAGTTLTIAANVSINPKISVVVYGNVIFNNGKLVLDDNASTLILQVGSTLTCTAGCGSNNQISIGTGGSKYLYKGSDLDVINSAPRPTTVDNTGSVLPIKLLFFAASLAHDNVDLIWATSMEENFEKFIIERSSTGTNFLPIGEVPGAGRNIYEIETSYTFLDESPLLGFNYYRLKAVDLDGQFEYFGVRVVKLTGPKQLSIYPNPSSGKSISFVLNFNPSENDQAVLVNSLGVELLRASVTGIENQLNFDNELSPGVYILKYLSTDFETNTRVVVSH